MATQQTKQKYQAPSHVLLATDLSARCDRALDRAAQLVTQWQAELVAVNVAENFQTPDMVLNWAYGNQADNLEILQRELRDDLAGVNVPLSARIMQGEAASCIAEAAKDKDCGLIVTGMARSEPFGRFVLGTTVEKLATMVEQPLLVVRRRPHGAYRKILVATDFSEASAHALFAALGMFPDNEILLYHAYKPALGGLAAQPAESRESNGLIEAKCLEFFESRAVDPVDRIRIRLMAEYGALEPTLTNYVRRQGVDLVVIGSHGQGGLMSSLLGSSASRLLHWLPCDTMLVAR